MPRIASLIDPPREVEQIRLEPSGLSFDTKPVTPRKVRSDACRGFTVGKSPEPVVPAMYAFPAASMAMSLGESSPLPQRKVEYTKALPSGLSFATNPSLV